MERVVLHSDLNNCYASIECLHRPEIKNKPVAVGGSEEARHGIILAKNNIAKSWDIKTGEALWQAKEKCPELVIVPSNYPLYLRFSRLARRIYQDYSDQVEAFGIDESWIDLTSSMQTLQKDRTGKEIADEIRERIKFELGITASIGVSYNKIFAKLGSDMKKPDATTVISKENYKDRVWPLPVEDLLYVGKSTKQKLWLKGIRTIGDLACADVKNLRLALGKWGETLWSFANGYDISPVTVCGEETWLKSVGNSITTCRDLLNENDVWMVVTVLAESVAARLQENGLKCQTVALHIRDSELKSITRQKKISRPTYLSKDIIGAEMELFQQHYHWQAPIRSIGVQGCDLQPAIQPQLQLFSDKDRERQEKLEETVRDIRRRFGNKSIVRANVLQDKQLTSFDPQVEHVIHPVNYF